MHAVKLTQLQCLMRKRPPSHPSESTTASLSGDTASAIPGESSGSGASTPQLLGREAAHV
jgi:hypothetical protein